MQTEFLESIKLILSRLARFYGEAVPQYRFDGGMDLNGSEGASIPVSDLVSSLWLSRFPAGQCVALDSAAISKSDLPVIWIDSANQDARLVKAILPNNKLMTESNDTESILDSEAALTGNFYRLSTAVASQNDLKQPRTAREWFWYALVKRRKIFAEAIFATFVISVLGLFAAMYTMQVYDRVIPTKGFETLWVLTVGVVLAIAFEFLLRQVRSIMTDRAAKAMDIELSSVFFDKAMDIRLDARPPTVGTFASQIRHFESVRNFLTSSVLFVLADVPFAFFFIFIVSLIAGYVALVPLVTVPLALVTSLFFRNKIQKYTEENMHESNKKNGVLIEAIDGIESIKAVGGSWKVSRLYNDLTTQISGTELKLKRISATASHLSMVLQQGNYAAIVAVGAYAITNGDLTMGGLIATTIIMGRVFSPLAQVPNLVVQWKQAQIALKSLDEIMKMPGERDGGVRTIVPDSACRDIHLSQARFGYDREKIVLDVGDLKINEGDKVAVLGSVGSGKSTLLKILAGLYRPLEGTCFVDEVDLHLLAPDYLRQHIGYLPQDVRLFNGTLRDNLTMGLPSPSDEQVLDACRITGLAHSIQNHPNGLELTITEGGKGLSGGQRQLVGLTRMLIMAPKILMLDEPTASMDSELENKVMDQLFGKTADDSTVIVVTHKRSVLKHVSRIVVLGGGKIVLDGPRDDVLKRIQTVQGAGGNGAKNSR